jgi:putative addiction module component (TIGR02574 family)
MSDAPKPFDYSQLSIPERILLAQEPWESVYDQAETIPLSEAQRREIERRWAAYEAGEMEAAAWPEIKRRLLET